MLRRKPNPSDVIKPVRLYLDDVKLIHDELAAVCNEVSLQTADYSVDSLDDLADYPKARIEELSVRGRDPHVGVTFTDVGAIIHQHDDSIEAVGLQTNVRNVLLSRTRPVLKYLTAWPLVTAAMFLASSSPGIAWTLKGSATWVRLSAVGVFVLAAAVALYGVYVRLWRGSVVYATTRSAAPSFVRRNADALAVNGMVALVSVVATYLLTR